MKATKAAISILAIIIASAIQTRAIEHLEISVQCTNVVLRWPCLDDGSEQFIIQYRSTLSPTDSWQTLETSLPATYGTNEMYYTNWGVVLNPVNCDGGGGFSMMMMGGGGMSLSASQPAVPMATPNNGGAAAPVKLYPLGFDFSNFTISVPGTSGSLSGAAFMQAEDEGSPLDPNDAGEGDGGTNTPLDVGFYRVVRNGAHMFGVTNGTVWSGKTLKGILGLVKDADTKQKVIELQMVILDLHERVRLAQTEHDEITKAKSELEHKLLEIEGWNTKAARYELRELADGIFVYALKAEHKSTEPEHFLCPHCFGEKKSSILQRPQAGYTNYVCHACKMDISPVKAQPFYGIATMPRRRNRLDGLIG